jgi:hypothetical protein
MIANVKKGLPLAVLAVLALVAVWVAVTSQPVWGQKEDGHGPHPRYTVIDTEGHNLIVTDNKTEKVYFYTIDKDAKIGSELKLRGTVDLKQVGKKVIKPTKAKHEREPKERE